MATVQFYGKDAVMEAAENLKCPAWAIFSGTALFMKFELNDAEASAQSLEQALDMLSNSPTVAVYKIKFFEIPEGSQKIKINEKTVCDGGSFSFKTISASESVMPYMGRAVVNTQTNEKLDKITQMLEIQQQRIDDLENMTEIEPEKETIGSVLIDSIKNPDKLMQLVNTIKMITGIGMSQPQHMSAIGNIPAPQNNSAPGYSMEDMEARAERLGIAIDKLEKADPLLVEHMEKLAKMSEENPNQFNMLIKML